MWIFRSKLLSRRLSFFILCENGYGSLGDLILYTCVFDHCFSNSGNGGGVYFGQDGTFFMHETLFSYCYSANNGGGVCAVKKYSSYPDYEGRQTIKDEQLYTFTSQYCCFQNCFGFTFGTLTIGSYGSSIYVCSYISNINYSSCVQTDFNFSPSSQSQLAYGAIVDLQATYSNFNSINLTNGQSKYCGGIEMRFTKYETFTFQTLTNISSNYIFSFDCLLDTANITYTNIVSNKIIAI